MFRLNLGALAIVAALAAPLAASAQTAPAAPPAAVAPGAPGAPEPSQAGQWHHRHHRHHRGIMGAMRNLNLTAAQKTQIAGILKSARDARKNQTTPLDPQTRRANMLAMRQQIDGVLTDTQRAQLATNLKNMRHMHKDGDAQRPPASAPQ